MGSPAPISPYKVHSVAVERGQRSVGGGMYFLGSLHLSGGSRFKADGTSIACMQAPDGAVEDCSFRASIVEQAHAGKHKLCHRAITAGGDLSPAMS